MNSNPLTPEELAKLAELNFEQSNSQDHHASDDLWGLEAESLSASIPTSSDESLIVDGLGSTEAIGLDQFKFRYLFVSVHHRQPNHFHIYSVREGVHVEEHGLVRKLMDVVPNSVKKLDINDKAILSIASQHDSSNTGDNSIDMDMHMYDSILLSTFADLGYPLFSIASRRWSTLYILHQPAVHIVDGDIGDIVDES